MGAGLAVCRRWTSARARHVSSRRVQTEVTCGEDLLHFGYRQVHEVCNNTEELKKNANAYDETVNKNFLCILKSKLKTNKFLFDNHLKKKFLVWLLQFKKIYHLYKKIFKYWLFLNIIERQTLSKNV